VGSSTDCGTPGTAETAGAGSAYPAGLREVGRALLSIALPVLPVLAAEPLYLLVDGVVVGRLGEGELAALGVGSLVLLVLGTQMNFLSYGTTARSARLHGAGREREAVAEGVQATWIALAVGLLVVAVVELSMGPLTRALAADDAVAARAADWLHVAVWGIPLVLVSSAGNGWMRGVQRMRVPLVLVVSGVALSVLGCLALVPGWGPAPALGLRGSAVANLAGQAVMATGFLVALVRARPGSLLPDRAVIVSQLRMGLDLVVRTASFQVTFAVATSTAAVAGVATLGGHHLAQQTWSLFTLVLDSVAVAAQSLVGAALGAGLAARGRALARAVVVWSLGLGVVLAVATALLRHQIAVALTSEPAVAERLEVALTAMALVLVPAALVFGLDGVLLGAGDTAYLRTTTICTAFGCFLPVLLLAHHFRWGLPGIWAGMGAFVLGRLVAVRRRTRGPWWTVTGYRVP